MTVALFSRFGTVTFVESVLGNVVEGCASRQQAWWASSHGGPNSKFWNTHAVPMEPDTSPSLQASQQSCKLNSFVLVYTVLLLLHLDFISEVLHNGKSWLGLQLFPDAHPVCYWMGTGGSFPEAKRDRAWSIHSCHPPSHLVFKLWVSETVPFLSSCCHCVQKFTYW